MQKSATQPLILVFGLIALAALGRALPYFAPQLGNFTPVFAVALFGGAHLQDKRLALLVPMLAMLISDAVIGFHSLMWLVYGCMAITCYLGMRLQNRVNSGRVLGSALLASVIFFVLSNAMVWMEGTYYAKSVGGLVDCFVAAIPFWRNELFGTLLWSAALFGGFALLRARASLPAQAV